MKNIECALVTLAVSLAMTCGESAQAAPRLQINRLTGEATILGVTGELKSFYMAAKSLELGASDVLDNVGGPDLADNDADDNSFSPPGSDSVADGEDYFLRNFSNLDRYVGFNIMYDSTVTFGPSSVHVGSSGFSEHAFGSFSSVIQPHGYVGGSFEPTFTPDLPHVLGIMFKPGNPNLTQASATKNLVFQYGVPGQGQSFDGQIVVIPEPCGLTLVAMGTLVALGACRRLTSKRTS